MDERLMEINVRLSVKKWPSSVTENVPAKVSLFMICLASANRFFMSFIILPLPLFP